MMPPRRCVKWIARGCAQSTRSCQQRRPFARFDNTKKNVGQMQMLFIHVYSFYRLCDLQFLHMILYDF